MRKTRDFSGKSVVKASISLVNVLGLYRVAELTTGGGVNKSGGFYQTLSAVLPGLSHSQIDGTTAVKSGVVPTIHTTYYYYNYLINC